MAFIFAPCPAVLGSEMTRVVLDELLKPFQKFTVAQCLALKELGGR